MNLAPGHRLTLGQRIAYEIVGPAFATPRHAYHRARKIFWNFRLVPPPLYEADPDECLDVLVRVPLREGHSALQFEWESVLSLPDLPGPPLPLDVLDTPEGPLLFLADLPGDPIPDEPPRDSPAVGRRARVLRDVLEMLAVLHHHELTSGGLDPRDFFLDDVEGLWSFLGTDRVVRAETVGSISEDISRWARLANFLLRGWRLGPDGAPVLDEAGASFPDPEALARGPDRDDLRWVTERVPACSAPGRPLPSAATLLQGSFRTRRPPDRVSTLRTALDALGRRLRRGPDDERDRTGSTP